MAEQEKRSEGTGLAVVAWVGVLLATWTGIAIVYFRKLKATTEEPPAEEEVEVEQEIIEEGELKVLQAEQLGTVKYGEGNIGPAPKDLVAGRVYVTVIPLVAGWSRWDVNASPDVDVKQSVPTGDLLAVTFVPTASGQASRITVKSATSIAGPWEDEYTLLAKVPTASVGLEAQ